ncbi:MAG TPA: DUF3499 family protein [Acidimicrobiales bacterium]
MTRACARPACSEAASATLTYDYQARVTWLDALSGDPHPMSYDLCAAHAEAMTVPRGWRLEDRRGEAARLVTPAP